MVPSTDWAFADCGTAAFPGSPDPTRLCLKNGFKPDTVYELRYIAKDPLVLGVGLAATRDINSFFRYEKQDAAGTPNPVAGRINWAISEGSSQSGTFLKLFVMLGFNQDEAGRKVWDGVESEHLGSKHRPESPVRAAGRQRHAVRARPRSAELVGRVERSGARVRHDERARSLPPDQHCPKILETFGSAEIWGLRQSYSLVGSTAKEDIALPPDVRRYYFPGVAHGGGQGGFSIATQAVTTALWAHAI